MYFSEKEINRLKEFTLFYDFNNDELKHLLECSGAFYKSFKKNDPIYFQNDKLTFLGIILNGSVRVEKIDLNGDNSYIIDLYKGNIFGEYLILDKPNISPYNYISSTNSTILCLPFYGKYRTNKCQHVCSCRIKFRENLLNQISNNNFDISSKVYIMSQKTLRGKILAFLNTQSQLKNSNTIKLNITKSKLAEYLGVNRSALARELSNMKSEKIIDFDKNIFTIL